MKRSVFIPVFLFSFLFAPGQTYDICVYGATSAGVIAAYTAAKMHKHVLLVEPGSHPGGLSSGGLGYTDIGNKFAISGIARNFYRRMGKEYGHFEQWIFEPHVAEKVFNDYLREGKVEVLYQYRIIGAGLRDQYIHDIRLEPAVASSGSGNRTITAKVFIDCSYEGDLMAKAGVSYTVGRESNSQYGETYNGVQLLNQHQFPDGIDPYKIPGNPRSGLLWGIGSDTLLPAGSGDKRVQAYNFRICLTSEPANRIAITRPEGYDSSWFELLARLMAAQPQKQSLNDYCSLGLMPNHKTDINNRGGFSTDMIGMNYDYPDASYARRAQIVAKHELYTKAFLWFLGHDPRVPGHIREEMRQWGYPKDEYTDNDHWTPQLYIRECRRMIGEYVMTQANCEGRVTVTDGIGLAAYTMDSHNCERLVVNGVVKNEGDVEKGGFGPYPVSYRSLVPRAEECKNLLVPVCLSASHIAYGSIRMEPVFMVLGQSSAVAASLAIDEKKPVQGIDIKTLQDILRNDPLADGSPPEILTDNDGGRIPVSVKGSWDRESGGGYGPSWLRFSSTGKSGEVEFRPVIVHPGRYQLYSYFPTAKGAARQTHYIINDGSRSHEIFVKAPEKVEGQTSGEWVSLGTYMLSPGSKASVTIRADRPEGVVVADAILWIPVK